MERLKNINSLNGLAEKVTQGKKILSIYFVAGYPRLQDTKEIILTLQELGVDIIEVGMPYSDPMVDGPVIQRSARKALSNGMNIDLLFEQLLSIKERIRIPLVLMGYYNQLFRYGIKRFIDRADHAGCSGILFPDLPLEEYISQVKPYTDAVGLCNIQLVTPHTVGERLEHAIHHTQGFLYAISNPMTTGGDADLSRHEDYFQTLSHRNVSVPKLLGFGIDNREKLDIACRYFDGAVIGSSFVKSLSSDPGGVKSGIIDFFERCLQWKKADFTS